MLQLGWFGLTNPWLLTAPDQPAGAVVAAADHSARAQADPRSRRSASCSAWSRRSETSARTPPWLLFLRLLLAALLILALAGPVFNPEPELRRRRAAGAGGRRRLGGGAGLGSPAAARSSASPPAPSATTARSFWSAPRRTRRRRTCAVLSATDAVRSASTWEAKPWPVDRMAALESLRGGAAGRRRDRLAERRRRGEPGRPRRSPSFARRAGAARSAAGVRRARGRRAPLLLLPPEIDGERLVVVGAARRQPIEPQRRRGQGARPGGRGARARDPGVRRRGDARRGAVRAAARDEQSHRPVRARAAATRSAAWSCSTSAGAAASSGWSANRRRRRRSRCCPSSTTSSGRWRRAPRSARARSPS